jgi:hypothetical protein
MGIGILNELQDEIKRLFIAGSSLAYNDFRLGKLLVQLKKMGESVPVFSRISTILQLLIEIPDNSEEKLLELSSIVSAVLYTQGEWEVTGETGEVKLIEADGTTNLSYRKLKPVIEALTNRGQGRYSIVSEAYNEGLFSSRDKRLIRPITDSLDDPYSELGYFVIENIVPVYGMTLMPFIKSAFDINGGKGHGRRLEAVNKICGMREKKLYIEAAQNGSADVKISAICILKDEKDTEELLQELAKDKRKEVREAAEMALKSRSNDGVLSVVIRLFKRGY